MKRSGLIISLALLLAACATPAIPPPTPPTLPPSETPPPTSTPPPTVTPTSTPRPTATVALPVSKGTALPASSERITAQNLGQLKLLAQWPLTLPQIRDMAISPDSQLVIAWNTTYQGGGDPALFRLDDGASPWKVTPDNGVPNKAVSFSPDGKLVQIQCGIYSTADGTLLHTFGTLPYTMNLCYNVTFFPDGTKVAVSLLHKGYLAHIWTVDGSEELQTIPTVLDGQTVSGFNYTISPDGSYLLMWQGGPLYERNAWLVSLPDWKFVKKFTYGIKGNYGAWDLKWAFSPDSKLLAIQVERSYMIMGSPIPKADLGNSMEVWRLSDMTRVLQYDFHDLPCGLGFSPSGDLLAERTEKSVVFRNTADWSIASQIEKDGCAPVLFTPDGTRLITGGGTYLSKDPASVLVYGVIP